jgi:peroxiredoxin
MKIGFSIIVALLLQLSLFAQQPTGLPTGSMAPDFELKDQSGKIFHLKEMNKEKTVIVLFYRGQWCPHCSKQLKGLQDSIDILTAKGAVIVAITPETTENVSKTIEKTKAGFPILSDNGLKVMQAYGVAFEVDAETIERYKKYGIDFDKANGSNGVNLPVPAMYIIKKGKVTWRYFDADYRKRPSVKQIEEQL